MSFKKAGQGDNGITRLYTGRKISKGSDKIDLLGTLDEVNAWLGLLNREISKDLTKFIQQTQKRVIDICSHIASYTDKGSKYGFEEKYVVELEDMIAKLDSTLPKLTQFIVPDEKNANFHIARSIVRQAERKLVVLQNTSTESYSPFVLKYLNRLSDFLFVLSRYVTEKEITYKQSEY